MTEPRFLSVDDVIAIHGDTIGHEGGLGGVRDYGLLASAVMMPQQRLNGEYLHDGMPAMAAAYLFHITQNHPFHDGNKRAGAAAAYVFLDVNRMSITATIAEFIEMAMGIAAGKATKADLTVWMQEHTQAI